MTKYAIAVDVSRCTGCHNCFIACKDEFDPNDYLPSSVAQPAGGSNWIRLKEIEHGEGDKVKVDYIPIMCQHCEKPVCAVGAPEGAVYKRDDGIVIIDPVKAKGYKGLVNACPYGVIFWNEEKQVAQKCTMCAHMLDSGEKTVRCVESCPTQAMLFGDVDDPESKISRYLAAHGEKIEAFKPEIGTGPSMKYVYLPRPFIAGEVLLGKDEQSCAEGVKVCLQTAEGKVLAETETDFLGDFEFKDLEKDVDYVVKAIQTGYSELEIAVRTNASKNLGELVLQPR